MKPIIGITTFYDNKLRRMYNSISSNYVDSVAKAGGIPVLIPIVTAADNMGEYLNLIDGLLLSGGEDVSPMLYGENPMKEVTLISEDRDFQEYELYLNALEMDMPILGICRGIQLMNAASGGTLYQDIHAQKENAIGHQPMKTPVDNLYHMVRLSENSILYDIFKKQAIKVNSFHHQAVKRPADNFTVTALSPDQIIEGMEDRSKAFVVGVQWHPEDLTVKYPEFLELFKAFVEIAKGYRARTRRENA